MVVEINVMIVDDDPVNLLFQKKIIQKNFSTIELFCCHNSQEALDLVQKQNIDLMILDVELPDIDGFELYERIRSICNVEIPAIYLSVHHKNQYIKKSFELGAIDYLIKPIDPNLYINRIKLYLELLSKNLELSELHRVSSETLDLVNHYVIASKADSKGIITEVTDAFCKISGYARDEMIGQPHNMVRHPEMSPDVFKEVWDTIKNGETWSGEIKNLKKDGSFYWVYAVISPMFDQEGHVTGYYSTRQDITADKEKTLHLKALADEQQKRKEVEQEAKEILDSTDSIVIVGDSNECTYVNRAFLNFFDVESLDDFKMKYDRVEKYFLKEDGFFNKDDFSSEKIWFQSIIEAGKEGALVKMQSFSGANEVHTFSMNVKLLNSTLKRYLVIFEDVTNLEQERTFYQEAATHDQLTGIYNRFFFKDELVRSLAAARRYGDGFGVIILDLDKFKLINDSYGHLAGDVVLKSVSKVIQNRLRNSDIFARWGGEEFIVLLPSTDIDEAAEVAEDLRLSIESFEIEKVGTITCSFGVTHWREGDNEKSLISRADEALYEAKKSGRNKVCKKLD